MNLAITRILQLVITTGYSLWKTLVVVNAFHEQTQYNKQFLFVCVLFYRAVASFIVVMLMHA